MISNHETDTECRNHANDPYQCIDCDRLCPQKEIVIKKLEKETGTKMSRQKRQGIMQKISAMKCYLEVMSTPDPTAYVLQKYDCQSVRYAKNKIYQWQHNYGTNLVAVKQRIEELEQEMAEYAKEQEKHQEQKPMKEAASEEKKMTRRQEEKISQGHLQQMRTDLENEYLQKEAEIEDHKKMIKECEEKMEEISSRITAIRQVLDIFKEKDAMYA